MKFLSFFQRNALHIAVQQGNLEITQLLLSYDGIDVNAKLVFLIQFTHKILIFFIQITFKYSFFSHSISNFFLIKFNTHHFFHSISKSTFFLRNSFILNLKCNFKFIIPMIFI